MIGWLDCSSGASGDMLLATLVDAGVPVGAMQQAIDVIAPERVQLRVEEVRRAGLRATRVHVDADESTTRRTWAQIRELIDGARLAADVTMRAHEVFQRLAEAEARVHGIRPTTCTSTRSAPSTRSQTWSASPSVSTRWAWPSFRSRRLRSDPEP